jgi:hypothetical protein
MNKQNNSLVLIINVKDFTYTNLAPSDRNLAFLKPAVALISALSSDGSKLIE